VASACTVVVLQYCTLVQKLLAQAKTRSLQGLLLDGYEDTVDQPEWLDMDPAGSLSYSAQMTEKQISAVDIEGGGPPHHTPHSGNNK